MKMLPLLLASALAFSPKSEVPFEPDDLPSTPFEVDDEKTCQQEFLILDLDRNDFISLDEMIHYFITGLWNDGIPYGPGQQEWINTMFAALEGPDSDELISLDEFCPEVEAAAEPAAEPSGESSMSEADIEKYCRLNYQSASLFSTCEQVPDSCWGFDRLQLSFAFGYTCGCAWGTNAYEAATGALETYDKDSNGCVTCAEAGHEPLPEYEEYKKEYCTLDRRRLSSGGKNHPVRRLLAQRRARISALKGHGVAGQCEAPKK